MFLPGVKDLFLGLPLAKYHFRKKKHFYFILLFFFFLLYCNLLYLCICKISAILKPVNVGTMLQKKTKTVVAFDELNKNQTGVKYIFLFLVEL